MPEAYARAMPGALPNPQCTDGRTDGQDEEPPSLDINLTLVDARRASDDITALSDVIGAGLWPTGERHPVVRTGQRAPIPSWTRAAVWYRDGGRCRLCPPHQYIEGPWHLDHIKPWSAGGSDTSDNLRVLCERHNMERGNQIIAEERPESLVTWWCSRCYLRDEHTWTYESGWPKCPTHPAPEHWSVAKKLRCPVQRSYRAIADKGEQFPTWHQDMTPLIELHTIAYCAHCNLRGLTGVTL